MARYTCPRCGSVLIDKDWERIQETSDGGVRMDAHPVYACPESTCGYMKRSEPIPEIIAQQGDDRLLLLYPNERGRVLDIKANVIFPEIHYGSILARGYWEDYKGNHDVEMLLGNARYNESRYLEKPNLFEFATSELSQDAFLCWLISWSPLTHRSLDENLHNSAVDFVTMIFNVHNYPVPAIENIEIIRQFEGLDILAIINDTYAILIEDKTYTSDHSDQLIRYREAVARAYPDKVQLPVYFKIADQSHYRSVDKAGYYPFKRERMLQVLRRGRELGVTHPIFLDYLSHLEKLDEKVHAYKYKRIQAWDGFAWQGFFQELQKEFHGNWDYVSNPRGGFWGFWWKPQGDKKYYLQLEKQVLTVKLEAEDGVDLRELSRAELLKVLEESKQRNLHVQKPARMRTGKTMTIAMRPDYLQTTEDGLVDLKKTIEELKKWDQIPQTN
jgi:hypothetical protein